MNVLVPLIIIIGILSAILGFYKIMFSSDDAATKEGTRYIIYGVIGIILIMSAKFIGQNVFDLLTNQAGIK
jgi:multisubunit Na+/H+ antiporter MnhG subunit